MMPSPEQSFAQSGPCQKCGAVAPTKAVTLQRNIGMIYARHKSTLRGWLCKACISKYFWEYTLTTLFVGWWGVISFFETLYILPSNIVNFVGARRLPRA